MKFLKYVAPAILLLAFVTLASANVLKTPNATFAFTGGGSTITYISGDGDLLDATQITLPVSNFVQDAQASYLGFPNDFTAGQLTPMLFLQGVSFSSLVLNTNGSLAPTMSFSSAWGNEFMFTPTSIVVARTINGGQHIVDIYYAGTFTDTTSTYYTSGVAASVSMTFTQTGGPTGQVGYGGTFATPPEAPPPPGTPEPATMALFGAGLLGLGLLRRKR